MKSPYPNPPSDAPEGTVSIGGPISWFDVSLHIRGDELDPASITTLFGIDPDFTQKKGVPLFRPDGSTKRISKFGSWDLSLSEKQTDEWDVEQAAWIVLQRLPDNIELWSAIPETASARLSFGLSLCSFSQGFSLEPEISLYVAERNISLDFHVYGNDENEA